MEPNGYPSTRASPYTTLPKSKIANGLENPIFRSFQGAESSSESSDPSVAALLEVLRCCSVWSRYSFIFAVKGFGYTHLDRIICQKQYRRVTRTVLVLRIVGVLVKTVFLFARMGIPKGEGNIQKGWYVRLSVEWLGGFHYVSYILLFSLSR